MRTYGRLNGKWVEVDTDAKGHDDDVWVTTLIQALRLTPGESPFFANYGIPGEVSVLTQVYPDYYVNRTRGQFAGHFASLSVSRRFVRSNLRDAPEPVYDIALVKNVGTKLLLAGVPS